MKYLLRMIKKKGLTDPIKLFQLIIYLPKFSIELFKFMMAGNETIKAIFPVAYRSNSSVNFEYWFQDIFVAREIIKQNYEDPDRRHLDVGSRVEGFLLALCAGGVNPTFGDINFPANLNVEKFDVDLQKLLPKSLDHFDSISCLHVIEHIGLGKYGDIIEPDGHLRSIERLKLASKPGCDIFISFPISQYPGVYFNSGRKLNGPEMMDFCIKCGFNVHSMSLVSRRINGFIENCSIQDLKDETEGCAIFHLIS